MSKIINHANFADHYTHEIVDGVRCMVGLGENYQGQISRTTPGMTLSLKQLIDRYTRGDAVAVFDPVYAGEEELPNLEAMTEMDRIDMARNLKGAIEEKREEILSRRGVIEKKAEKLIEEAREKSASKLPLAE